MIPQREGTFAHPEWNRSQNRALTRAMIGAIGRVDLSDKDSRSSIRANPREA